jgi:iron complex outermembrane recepter protein
LLAGLVTLVASPPLLAQDTPDESGGLQEVVITAEKREGTVQDTPISITAFTGEDLANAGITSTEALAGLTPGLTVQKEVIGKVVIRGVGTENFTVGSDPGVAIHKDGVYIARSSVAIFDFFDVSRIEVLRGPQGTLYGRNATGGVVNIVSNEPTGEFDGSVKLDLGNYSKRRAEVVLNGGVTESVQGRVSVLYGERDGYSKNIYPGRAAVPPSTGNAFGVPAISSARDRGVDELDNQDLFAVRGQLKFNFSDAGSLLLGAEVLRDDSVQAPFKYFDTSSAYWFNVVGPDQALPDLRTVSQGFENVIPGTTRTVPDVARQDQDSAWARFDWDFGAVALSSLTGYRKIDFNWINDGDGFDTLFVNYFQADSSKQFTQEFQLTNSDADARLQWIVGAFYLDESADTFTGIPFLAFGPNAMAPYIIWDGASNTQSYAVFGQGTYSFTDRLRLTLGARYNKDEKDGFLNYDLFGLGVFPRQALDDSWDSVTPKLGIDFDFSEDVLGYFSATRGFKSGGFNLIAFQDPYDPEYLWAFETGLKSKSADGRIIANIGAFYYDYKDMQVGKVVNLSATVANAGAATIKGAEAEVRAVVGGGLELNLGLSWLDAKYDEFETQDPGFSGNPSAPGALGCGVQVGAPAVGMAPPNQNISLADCRLPRAPEFQGNIGLAWNTPVANGGSVGFRGDYAYRSKQFFTQFNRESVAQDGYGVLNARFSYRSPSDRWSIAAYGNNLTDKDYFVTVLESGVAAGGTVVPQAVVGAPRTYGIVFDYNF